MDIHSSGGSGTHCLQRTRVRLVEVDIEIPLPSVLRPVESLADLGTVEILADGAAGFARLPAAGVTADIHLSSGRVQGSLKFS